MKNKIAIMMLLATLLFGTTAFAQMLGTVKGKVLGFDGQPMVGATLVYENLDNGRKSTLKTDKRGEFFSMGMPGGTYKITLLDPAGKELTFLNKVKIGVGENLPNDFNLQKDRQAAAQSMSEEQKKAVENQQKETQKIKGLNAMLTQAADLRKAGSCDQAATLMAQAVQQDTVHDIIFASYAESLACAKKYPEAIEAYKKAIAIAPTKGEYHNELGQAYLKANQVDDAMAEYEKAAQLDPTKAGMYYFNEGAVLTNKGRADDAVKAFDKALAADPNKAEAYYWKGVNMLGKATIGKDGKMTAPEGTSEAFNKYLELQPEGQYADASKQLLLSVGAKVETNYGKSKKK